MFSAGLRSVFGSGSWFWPEISSTSVTSASAGSKNDPRLGKKHKFKESQLKLIFFGELREADLGLQS